MGLRDELKRVMNRWRKDRRHAVLLVTVEVAVGAQPVHVEYAGPDGFDLQLAQAVLKMIEDRNAGKRPVS